MPVTPLHKIIRMVEKAQTDKDKVAVLKKYDSNALREILAYAYNKNLHWLLPLGTPPYKPNRLVDQEGRFYGELRRLKYFVKESGAGNLLKQPKREAIFIEILESLDPKDAQLLIDMKDREIPGCPKHVVKMAFPNIQGLEPDEKKKAAPKPKQQTPTN
jgi:hypothetical protein